MRVISVVACYTQFVKPERMCSTCTYIMYMYMYMYILLKYNKSIFYCYMYLFIHTYM